MQVRDEDYANTGRIISAEMGDQLELLDKQFRLLEAGVKGENIIIRPMPKEGERFELQGLVFKVTRDLGRGRLIIKLLGTEGPE